MTWKPHKLTREDLYEAVWLEPMSKLAKRYGVSDVALAKVCRRHNVPLPGRGYWAKLAAGKAPAKPPLPPVEGDEEPILIGGRDEPLKEDAPPDPEIAAAVEAHTPAQPIEVPGSLEGAAPVVRRTLRALKGAKADERGLRRTQGPGRLQVAVTKDSMDRALRIADGLVRACQDLGLMTKSRAADAEAAIQLEGQSITFSITEKVTRTERHETPAERRQRERAPYFWDRRPQYDYHPTGWLTLRLDGYGDGTRVSWGDGKTQRLEDLLADFIAGAVRLAVIRRRQQEEAEASRKAREEAERLRRDAERQYDQEQRWCERLFVEVELWQMAGRLRDFVEAKERALAEAGTTTEPGSEQSAYVQWVALVADQLDPTAEAPLYRYTLDAMWNVCAATRTPLGINTYLDALQRCAR